MKNYILLSVAALLTACFSLSGCSSAIQSAALKQFGLDSKKARVDLILSLLADGYAAVNADSTEYLVGTWAFSDGQGTFDTLWFYNDSTVTSHFVSKKDTIDLLQTGGFLYYSSYKQALVQYNGAHNYLTHKDIPNWSMTYIYDVSKMRLSALGINQLTLTELNQTTGEAQSQTTYKSVVTK